MESIDKKYNSASFMCEERRYPKKGDAKQVFKMYKKYVLKAAKELQYDESYIRRLKEAEDEYHINRILREAREAM